MSDTDRLTKLGSATKYQYDRPTKEILETFDNQHEGQAYLVPFVMPYGEFTSLCPKTGQPDFAAIEIVYIPNKKMVESKSLKLYLGAFRNSGEFHEDVVNRIAKDLSDVLDPLYIRVYGDFAPRGGLAIKPMVEYFNDVLDYNTAKSDTVREFRDYIFHLVNSFDMKK